MKTFRAPVCARLVPVALVSLLLLLLGLSTHTAVQAESSTDSLAAPEVRALWVTRFVWPDRQNPESSRANITRILDEMKTAGFNVVLFQVRGECETLYPSHLEPWSPLIGGQDPGFDPLAFAIEEARARGLELHAYINPIPLHPTAGGLRAPSNPEHLFYRHGPNTAEPWVAVDEKGEPATSEYYYLSPGIPQVHAYIREVVRDLATRYDLDGIHIDRIRYPGREYSHDAISKARFAGRGNPNQLDWGSWQREQLDKLVNDMAAEIREINPRIVFSAAVWGIYRRDHIEGYQGFSSGYHDYGQDSWRWVKLGAMDVLAPMIYWDIPDPKPNYHELMEDFIGGVGGEAFWGGLRRFAGRPEETIDQIERTRAAGGAGTVIFAYRNNRDGSPDDFLHLREGIYAKPAPVPMLQRLVAPATGGLLGTVVDSAGSPVTDAWAKLSPAPGHSNPEAEVFRLVWTSSADGRFAFMNVPPGPVLVEVTGDGVSASSSVMIEAGQMASITLELPAVLVARGELLPPSQLAVVRPANDSTTTASSVNIIGRTEPGTTVTVGGQPAEVFATGVFVRDLVPLESGENLIEVVGVSPAGGRLTQTLRVVRDEPRARTADATTPARPRFTSPEESLIVRPGDDVSVVVMAPAEATAVLHLGDLALPLTAASGDGTVQHRGTFIIPSSLASGLAPAKLTARVTLPGEPEPVMLESPETLEVWAEHRVVMAETTSAHTSLMHGIHGVRLGGPFITELPAGIHLRLTGAQGNRYRVTLAPGQTGWVDRREVSLLPEGTPIPRGHFTSVSIGGGNGSDSVRLAVPAAMPHAVRAEIAPNRIELDLFGAHHAATWVSHRNTSKVVGSVSLRQLSDDHLRVTIPVTTRMIWGYYVERSGNSLTVHVRHAPDIAFGEDVSPLKGLLIAVEAGHGGRDSGAVGFTGATERDVNRAASDALEVALLARGAKVLQVRPGNEGLSLGERAQAANDAGAHLYVSMHANAASTDRGYLRVSGTSMYYKEDHCALLARMIYEELLTLGWPEFGLVGNFNYLPLRNSRVPAVLVEQAFMSHPGDEARLLDPEYQRQQAEAITRGLERFLMQVAE